MDRQHAVSGFAPIAFLTPGYGLPGNATLGFGTAWLWQPVGLGATSMPLSPVAGSLPATLPVQAAAAVAQPMQGAGIQPATGPVEEGHCRLGSPVVAAPGKPDAPSDGHVANAVVARGNAVPTVEQGTNAQAPVARAVVAQRVNEQASDAQAAVHGQGNPAPSLGLQPNCTLGMYGEYKEDREDP
jgi:hypothetical protein